MMKPDQTATSMKLEHKLHFAALCTSILATILAAVLLWQVRVLCVELSDRTLPRLNRVLAEAEVTLSEVNPRLPAILDTFDTADKTLKDVDDVVDDTKSFFDSF